MNKVRLGDISTVLISNVDKVSVTSEKPVFLCNYVDVYRNWAITKNMINTFMCASATQKEIDYFTIKKGDIAITKDSETRDDIGISTYFADSLSNTLLGYHCAMIRVNNDVVYGKYLNAFLHTTYARKFFELNASGSGQRYTLSADAISDLMVLLPKMQIQKLIGNFFSNIDRKIELNKRINNNLEQQAKTLYDYWFTQFNFPDANGNPYRSSCGKMKWNSLIKTSIPSDWSVLTLKECIKHITTGLNPRDNFILNNGNIKYITVKNLTKMGTLDISTCDTINEESKTIIHRRSQVSVGDILFASIAPLGRCVIVYAEPKDWEINESVFSIRPNTQLVSSEYLYLYFMSNYFVKRSEHNSTGSVFGGLRISALEEMPIIVPSDRVMQDFSRIAKTILSQKNRNQEESSTLLKLRDWLLPILMNGQATIVE